MNLTMTILTILNKYKGKPVVSHAITRAVAESPEILFLNEVTRAQREEWGWTEEQIREELEKGLQTQVILSLGKLKRNGFADRIRIERGAKLKEQIKKTGLVFVNPKWLTLCTVAYKTTEAGSKLVHTSKMKQ